jgi:hypothetical protein
MGDLLFKAADMLGCLVWGVIRALVSHGAHPFCAI